MRWNSEFLIPNSEFSIAILQRMGKAVWGAEPEFFGPRHAHREDRITRRLLGSRPRCRSSPRVRSRCRLVVADPGPTRAACHCSRSLSSVSGCPHRMFTTGRDGGNGPGRRRRHHAACRSGRIPSTARPPRRPSNIFPSTNEPCTSSLESSPKTAWMVGTVPAGPSQWSDWDDWAGHLRRYSKARDAGSSQRARASNRRSRSGAGRCSASTTISSSSG